MAHELNWMTFMGHEFPMKNHIMECSVLAAKLLNINLFKALIHSGTAFLISIFMGN